MNKKLLLICITIISIVVLIESLYFKMKYDEKKSKRITIF